MLKGMEKHHLPANQRPRHIQLIGQVQEHFPELVHRISQGWQNDRPAHR
jgi:hypothetical protein